MLGNMYYSGNGIAQDNTESAKWYRKAADQGDPAAQFNLGNAYNNGEGVGQDYQEAAIWYRKAAEQGITEAAFNLGSLYYKGHGVDQDYQEAEKWWEMAAAQGNARAQENLDDLRARKRDSRPNPEAEKLYNLGMAYLSGNGAEMNDIEALKCFKKAADMKLPKAFNAVGCMYKSGTTGVAKDYSEAIRWFRLGVSIGDDGSQNNLGILYQNGCGLAQDNAEAAKLYRMAAMQGNDGAQYNLGRLYLAGQGVPKDYSEAMKWFRMAAEQDYAYAYNDLAYNV